MLELNDYSPIDTDSLKRKWDEIMNIPNNIWEEMDIEKKINLINNTHIPKTLRVVELNTLPALVIEILDNKSTYTDKQVLAMMVETAMIAKGDEWIPQEDDEFKSFLGGYNLLELFKKEYGDF